MTADPKPAARGRILVVDDEPSARLGLEKLLRLEGFHVQCEADGQAALRAAGELAPDVVVTDLKMPGMDGIELLRQLRAQGSDVPVVVATAFGEVASAVAAMRVGADDYLTKPIDIDELVLAIERASERRSLRSEAENLRRQLRERDGSGLLGLLGASAPMQKVYQVARQVAGSRATVLITGESGTGKGELARAVHALSPRAKAPMVVLHCAALAEGLLERRGRFEQAHGGTLFLDEIGEITPALQVKLLRLPGCDEPIAPRGDPTAPQRLPAEAVIREYGACYDDCSAAHLSATNRETCKLDCDGVAEERLGVAGDPAADRQYRLLRGCLLECLDDASLSATNRSTCLLTCADAATVASTPAPHQQPAPASPRG